jgi:hypothetical protein
VNLLFGPSTSPLRKRAERTTCLDWDARVIVTCRSDPAVS